MQGAIEKCYCGTGMIFAVSVLADYSYRHTYTTNALQAGTDPAVLAELLGHGDLKMIVQNYGHLYQRHDHLKQAAADAVKRTG